MRIQRHTHTHAHMHIQTISKSHLYAAQMSLLRNASALFGIQQSICIRTYVYTYIYTYTTHTCRCCATHQHYLASNNQFAYVCMHIDTYTTHTSHLYAAQMALLRNASTLFGIQQSIFIRMYAYRYIYYTHISLVRSPDVAVAQRINIIWHPTINFHTYVCI